MAIYNFSPGPAKLDESVIQQAQDAVGQYGQTGMSILEISHRSDEFKEILENTKANLRNLLDIPQDYFILFLQGGATYQNALLQHNFRTVYGEDLHDHKSKIINFLVTGTWGKKTYYDFFGPYSGHLTDIYKYFYKGVDEEGFRIAKNALYFFLRKQSISGTTWGRQRKDYDYTHITSNETIEGVQIRNFNLLKKDNLIIDMSSDIGSYMFNWSNVHYVYAGAQKNMGIPGATICIGRNDLKFIPPKGRTFVPPSYLNLRELIDGDSVMNTPSTYSIFVLYLVSEWMIKKGGIEYFENKSIENSNLFYNILQKSSLIDQLLPEDIRSRSNVVFKFRDENLESKFLDEAAKNNIIGIKGHRSVGGVRISLYNAVTKEMVDYLSNFLDDFLRKNEK